MEEGMENTDVGSLAISTLIGNPVVDLPSACSLKDVVDTLIDGDVGIVVLKEADRVVGVVSERDVVRALHDSKDIDATKATEVASANISWCDSSASVNEVASEMTDHYVRHVLVEKGGELVGVVSARDLVGIYAT